MSNRPSQHTHPVNPSIVRGLTVFAVGLMMILPATYSIGVTSAIAWPGGTGQWAQEHGLSYSVVFLWNLIVVYGLGIGIMALTLQAILYRWVASPTFNSAALFLSGALLGIHVVMPIIHDYPIIQMFQRSFYDWTLEMVLLIASALALWISSPPKNTPSVTTDAGRA